MIYNIINKCRFTYNKYNLIYTSKNLIKYLLIYNDNVKFKKNCVIFYDNEKINEYYDLFFNIHNNMYKLHKILHVNFLKDEKYVEINNILHRYNHTLFKDHNNHQYIGDNITFEMLNFMRYHSNIFKNNNNYSVKLYYDTLIKYDFKMRYKFQEKIFFDEYLLEITSNLKYKKENKIDQIHLIINCLNNANNFSNNSNNFSNNSNNWSKNNLNYLMGVLNNIVK